MQKCVLTLAAMLIVTAIPSIFGEVELPESAVECMEDDKRLFIACEAEHDLEGITKCAEKLELENENAVELAEKCTTLKSTLTAEQKEEYMRRIREELNPEQVKLLADIGY